MRLFPRNHLSAHEILESARENKYVPTKVPEILWHKDASQGETLDIITAA